MTLDFRCEVCGELHRDVSSFSTERPLQLFDLSDFEIGVRVEIDTDFCVIRPPPEAPDFDKTSYFVRSVMEIPIHDCDEPLVWGLWPSVSAEWFERIREVYGESAEGLSCFAWVWSAFGPYGVPDKTDPPAFVPCSLRGRSKGLRPTLHVQECDHQIYIDQTEGISRKRAIEIATAILHPDDLDPAA